MNFSQGHWTFLGPGSEEKWYGSSSHAQKGQWTCTAHKLVQRFKETSHLVFKSISASSRTILTQKEGKTSIHFIGDWWTQNSCSKQFFLRISSVFYGGVANRCYQFGSTEEKNRRAIIIVDKFVYQVEARRSITFGISSDKQLETGCEKKLWASTSWLVRHSWHNYVKKTLLPISCCSLETVQNSTRRWRRMENHYSLDTQRNISTNERKWKVIHAHSSFLGYLAGAVSEMVTMLRHYDQEGQTKLMVRDMEIQLE